MDGREMFQKASLSLSAPKNTKQLKRKVHLVKPKSTSSKPKGKTKDFLTALRNKENGQRCSSVKKSSKKLLTGGTQRVQSTTLNSDLKRVLGHSPLANIAAGQLVVRGAVSSPSSRAPEKIPLEEINRELSRGLHIEEVFPNCSLLLHSTKAEIRKIVKQSNPESFEALRTCFAGSHMGSITEYGSLIGSSGSPHQLDTSPQSCLSDGPFLCDAMTNSTPSFMMNTLCLESVPSFSEREPSPVDLPVEDVTSETQSDLLDLADSFPTSGGWGASPVKRPRLFPQKLY